MFWGVRLISEGGTLELKKARFFVFMELQLFKPVPTGVLTEAYGVTLAKVRAGDKDEQTQKRLYRLRAELERLGVPVKKVPGVMLGKEAEADFYRKSFAPYYELEVEKMTWGELMMDFSKLSEYGLYDAAEIIRNEMIKRGTITEDDCETIVDSFCVGGTAV